MKQKVHTENNEPSGLIFLIGIIPLAYQTSSILIAIGQQSEKQEQENEIQCKRNTKKRLML